MTAYIVSFFGHDILMFCNTGTRDDYFIEFQHKTELFWLCCPLFVLVSCTIIYIICSTPKFPLHSD